MVLNKKIKGLIAIAIIISIIVPTVIISGKMYLIDDSNKKNNQVNVKNEDRQMAGDISNMTGVKTEEILLLKSQGRSWNEVLEVLKKNDYDTDSKLQSDIDRNTIESLKKQGFNEQSINEAISILEQVEVQLKEISSKQEQQSQNEIIKPTPVKIDNVLKQDSRKEDYKPYIELLEKIDKKTALIMMLKLSKKFGSYQKVLDEYLLSLQIGINMELLVTDPDEYEKQKKEKMQIVAEIISIEKIEKAVLDLLQKKNEISDKSNITDFDPMSLTQSQKDLQDVSMQNQNIVQQDKRPKSPTSDVMDEINNIKSQTYNSIGR